MKSLIASRPCTGGIGMLWYVASSVKYAASSSGSGDAHSLQKSVTS